MNSTISEIKNHSWAKYPNLAIESKQSDDLSPQH